MTNREEIAKALQDKTITIHDFDQVVILDEAGLVVVNVVANLKGYYMIHHAKDLTEDQAIGMALLGLIRMARNAHV